jgi:hypothetical protein
VRFTYWHVNGDVFVLVVVDDVVLVLADDIHGTQDIERVVDSSLHILEVNFLSGLGRLVRNSKDLHRRTLCTSRGFRWLSECRSP